MRSSDAFVRPTRRQFAWALPALAACGGPRFEAPARRGPQPIASNHARDPVGPLRDVDRSLHWAFADDGFEPLPAPLPGDWLAEHAEEPQSYGAFVLGEPNRPTPERRTLVVTRVGGDGGLRPTMAEIVSYLGAFFGLPVEVGERAPWNEADLEPRTGASGMQLRTEPILDALEPMVPEHAYAMLAVTDRDLYPDAAWNFVFGMARLHARVGVFSLARYDPRFDGRPAAPAVALRRGLEVLSHEVGHMFGISHCVHYRCVMNGFNNMAELDRTPMQLCRVCLRKLHALVAFDPAARYRAIDDRLAALGLDDERPWIAARLAGAPRDGRG